MDEIKKILLGTDAKRFLWTTFAGFLGLIVIYLSGIDSIYTPIVIALIAGITKKLNNEFGK